jgi:hypothetical protein
MAGPRASLYAGEGFVAFRDTLTAHEPDRPERLDHPWFERSEPEELLYDEIESLWADIAEREDWRPFGAKLAALETARTAWGYAPPGPIEAAWPHDSST